ncbi:MAG: hypothetical protein M3022_01815 [Actinomycetota bacterium]|nr:hypothetical protein [Actinomycetota bacterium]
MQAAKKAKAQSEQADGDRAEKAKQAVSAERKRKQSSQRAKAQSTKKIGERARRKKLEALDAKTESLAAQEQALTAADEARRLREAAGAAKTKRENNGR